MKRIFFFLSILLHPLWIPTWVLSIWYAFFLSDRFGFFSSTFGYLLGYELFFMAFIPGLVALSFGLGRKTNFEMSSSQSRIWPFLIGGIFWLAYTINIGRDLGKMADLIWITTGSGGILLMVLSFCNFKGYKFSAHAAGWAILPTLLTLNQSLPHQLRLSLLTGSILLTGVVVGIRWISGAHRWEELVGGLLLGVIISFSFIQITSIP